MNISDIEAEVLTKEHIDYIWPRMREADRKEAYIQGVSDKRRYHPLTHDESGVFLYKGEPVCAFGIRLYGDCVILWAFGTDKIMERWRTIHRAARYYIDNVCKRYPDKSIIAQVWEGHTHSIRWLKLLGFVNTETEYTRHGERVLIVERK